MAILEWNKNPHQKKQYEYDIQSADDMIHFFARNTISMLFHGLQFIYQLYYKYNTSKHPNEYCNWCGQLLDIIVKYTQQTNYKD